MDIASGELFLIFYPNNFIPTKFEHFIPYFIQTILSQQNVSIAPAALGGYRRAA